MTKPEYIELAKALALQIHRHLYKLERRINLPSVMIFDDVCMSNFQIPAGVLTKLGILRPFEGSFRHHEFTCEPENFEITIKNNIETGCDYDVLILALICIVDHSMDDNADIFSLLVKLGVCEAEYEYVQKGVGNYKVFNRDGTKAMKPRIKWTEKKKHYDEIGRNWTVLIA